MFKRSIQTKIIFIVSVIIFFSMGAGILTNVYFFTRESLENTQSKAIIIGDELKSNLKKLS